MAALTTAINKSLISPQCLNKTGPNINQSNFNQIKINQYQVKINQYQLKTIKNNQN